MAVIKIAKSRGYTVMSNHHLRDKELSLKAKGLLSVMLSLPDEWHYSVRGMTAICKEGLSSISSILHELMGQSYVTRSQPTDPETRKFQEIVYTIYEFPQAAYVASSPEKCAAASSTPSVPYIPQNIGTGAPLPPVADGKQKSAVIRVERSRGYSVMSNHHLRDTSLSLKAKGLLSIMLSLPDNWEYSVRGLAAICKEGVTSISSTLHELMDYGYVLRFQPMDVETGKFCPVIYTIYEFPQHPIGGGDSTDGGIGSEGDDDASDNGSGDASPDEGDVCPDGATDALDDEPFCGGGTSGGAYTDTPDAGIPDSDIPDTGSPDSGAPHTDLPHTENPYTGTPNPDGLYAKLNKESRNKEKLNTDLSNYPSINQGAASPRAAVLHPDGMDGTDSAQREFLKKLDARRVCDEYEGCREIIRENIGYDSLCITHPCDRSMLDGIVELLTETVCATSPFVRISGQEVPREVVKARFLKLDYSHIEYVLTCLSQNTTRVRNMKAYLLATLYNAPSTMDAYYQNRVQSDFPEMAKP